ncbi:lyase family protein [Candidatus Poribacteria bacterium]
MKDMSRKIRAMFDGLGIDPQDIVQLTDGDVSQDDLYRLSCPFPALGRYGRYITFMDDLTSLKALYKYRVMVIVEYFIALADTMTSYNGRFSDSKIIPRALTEPMKEALRSIESNLTPQQMIQIETIEKKSDHDTAAITDWTKFIVDQRDILGFSEAEGAELEQLENCLDGFHFGRTSEDVNSPVFALINRGLFFKYVIPEVIAFQEAVMEYAQQCDRATAGLTHGQPAEPTTIGKQLMNTVAAIDSILRRVFLPYDETGTQTTISFPVKTFGAVGNHSDLRSAYPDIDWIENDRRFVAALGSGLHLDMMATQASLYGEYKYVYDAVCTISRHILKFARDFWGWTSFQWFKKRKKEGVKGSSVMPNKYNPWRIEGASKILEKFVIQLEYTAKALMDYPYEGDMGRSIIMRDIGDDFAKFFIALGRIREELQLYEVNEEKVDEFLQNNPGLVGGAAQTILKRARVPGDAYRYIQQVMINPDGSYVSQEQFMERMRQKIAQGEDISPEVGEEILHLADPENNTGYAQELMQLAITKAEQTIQGLKKAYMSDY